MEVTTLPFSIGQRVFFRTKRGSYGWGRIRTIQADRFLIDPDPDAVSGRDFWILNAAAASRAGRNDYWGPRDRGIRLHRATRHSEPWFQPDYIGLEEPASSGDMLDRLL
jgi:hypothetical protein